MSRRKKMIAVVAVAGAAFAAAVAPASACACTPPGFKVAARWELRGGGQLHVTANRHTTARAAQAVGHAWLDTSTWSPGTLYAGGKRWGKYWSKKYGSYARMLQYVSGRQIVTLYWSKYGAG